MPLAYTVSDGNLATGIRALTVVKDDHEGGGVADGIGLINCPTKQVVFHF